MSDGKEVDRQKDTKSFARMCRDGSIRRYIGM